MPAERVSMRRVREILRLKYEAGASDLAITRSADVARSTVRLCLDRGVDPTTGEVRTAQVFVAVLGASSYTYAG